MIFDTKKILKTYPWLKKKKMPMIISSSYDGLLCAALLKHHLNWDLVGYYNHESLWVSEKQYKIKKKLYG